jgi:nucleotide-binding universal stress UspA family protein
MSIDARPAVVAYDSSEPARAAVRTAASVLAGRTLLVVTVWEPGLAMTMASVRDPTGLAYGLPSAEQMATIDRVERDAATASAMEGARIARELGATAMPLPIPDDVDAAATIVAVAQEHDACAIVVGSRDLGRVAAQVLGSTSRELLRRADRPVMVVKATT